jgi:hypothetical protein
MLNELASLNKEIIIIIIIIIIIKERGHPQGLPSRELRRRSLRRLPRSPPDAPSRLIDTKINDKDKSNLVHLFTANKFTVLRTNIILKP